MVSLKKKKPEIDLKKDRETSLDLGKKIDTDIGAGGISFSTDITEFENGDKISIGYEVEAPIQVGIDYNVSSNELGLSGGFEAPGDLVGLSGGVTIDLNSGEITGGELGVALGGVEVSIGNGKCERTISISIAGVTTSYTQKKDDPGCGDDDENDDDDESDDDDEIPPPNLPSPTTIPGNPGDILTCWFGNVHETSYIKRSWELLTANGYKPYSKQLQGGNTNTTIKYNKESGLPESWNRSGSGSIDKMTYYDANGTPTTTENPPNYPIWYNIDISIDGPTITGEYTYILQYAKDRQLNENIGGVTSFVEYHSFGFGDIKDTMYGYAYVCSRLIYCLVNGVPQKLNEEPPKNTPITPPEKEDMSCCDLEPVLSLLRKMSKVLAVDEMDGEGVKIPKRLFVPQGKGYEECKTYSHLFATQVRIQDHLGIHPFKAELADSNAAQAGNQKMSIQVINATAFAKLQSELLLENKSDSATRLNLLVRNTVAVGQILNGVTIAAKRAREIMRFLSIPVKETIDHINMPFDFSFGNRDKKKGFQAGAKPAEALDINTEEATEAMLPKFMVNSKQPYVIEIFDDKQGTLLDILLKQNK